LGLVAVSPPATDRLIMSAPQLTLGLLLTLCLTLATYLQPWHQGWAGSRAQQPSLLGTVLGDSRRLFANHFYVKADEYFHRGYYPTIFDQHNDSGGLHIAHSAGAAEEAGERESDFLGQPKDWIDRFGRNFFPSRHMHLGEDHDADGHGQDGPKTSSEKELLPWLRLSATLDPQRIESYTVSAYWLRQMNRYDEAIQFLRDGLRANPYSHEILLELGRTYAEGKKDPQTARNLWELALRRWNEHEPQKPKPNYFILLQICTELTRLELSEKHFDRAVEYLEIMKKFSPNSEEIRKRIEEIKAGKY
jgi:tetratricopeptide (TPR) repeat protein